MLSLLAQWFERLIDPYRVAGPMLPQAQFLACLRRCADGLRPQLPTVTLLTADIAAAEPLLFSQMANLVDWFATEKPEQLWRYPQPVVWPLLAVLLGSVLLARRPGAHQVPGLMADLTRSAEAEADIQAQRQRLRAVNATVKVTDRPVSVVRRTRLLAGQLSLESGSTSIDEAGAQGHHVALTPTSALGGSTAPFGAFKGDLMAESDKVFAGSIPKFYDTLMVPLIFEAYAANMAELVAAFSPDAVLETAAGSGAVTRALAPRLKSDVRYVVTDLNQPMLDYAAARQGFDGRIEWRQADALALPFEDASFDVVCCQFGAMFFPNRVGGYAEARRVLRRGGSFVFNVWDRIEENAFADDVTNAVAAVFPHDPPRFLARTPHGYHDVAHIRDELRLAGFADIRIETRAEVSRSPTAQEVATAYCQGTPLRSEIEARDASLLQFATDRAAQAITDRHGEGVVAGKIQAHVIVAAG
jgi:ubiquinone/menaquinone biosynthesis C-methylase UbiE